MQVYLGNTYSYLLWPRQGVMKLINLEMGSTVFKSGVFLAEFGHKLLLS